jgi:hypothetical protein
MKFIFNFLGYKNYTNSFLKIISQRYTFLAKNFSQATPSQQKLHDKVTKIGNNKEICCISEIASNRLTIGITNGMIQVFNANEPYNQVATIKTFKENDTAIDLCKSNTRKAVKVRKPVTYIWIR